MACVERNRPVNAGEVAWLLDADAAEAEPPVDLVASRRAQERRYVEVVPAASGGNQAEAARKLGISRTMLWRKLAKE
jgi:DNA-binding NtrC family response regulator